jgi:transposase-like protein
LKERAARWIAERRAAGQSVESIASELGVAPGTVLRWSANAPSKADAAARRSMVPVKVVSEPKSQLVSVVSPAGYRIEGLTLSEAAALLQALG